MRLGGYLEYADFSPDDRFVATTGFGTVRVWDSNTGLPATPLFAHPKHYVKYAEFEADGLHLLTVDGESTGQRWDISHDLRPVKKLLDLARGLSGQKIDTTGTPIHLSREEFQEIWERLRESN